MGLAFREGKWYVICCILLLLIAGLLQTWLVVVPLGALIFVLYFFRDPVRQPLKRAEAVLAPADGTVTKVSRTNCQFVGDDAWEVSIFMSPLNVHVNRSPVAGEVVESVHRPGRFLPAMNPGAPLYNEKNLITVQGDLPVKIVQIAGIVARRVVSWVQGGQAVAQGEKIGMIKFSSCTQIIFPGNVSPLVKVGDKVIAGCTIIGERVD
ncbi:MAG: phosphatidylserine decarboxylase [Firmicutes bacterium]|nr:phosphatidylserine decarboxylase [Bacillota bacterium]